mgnify:CR=1 FL=1
MDEFVSAAIAQKPNDIIKFGANWFASLREGQKGACLLSLRLLLLLAQPLMQSAR